MFIKKTLVVLLSSMALWACVDDEAKVEEPLKDSPMRSSAKDGHEFEVDPSTGAVEFKAEVVYFEYDKSTLTSEGMARLDALVSHMKKHGKLNLTVTGHCDERGSAEYNLALGSHRAHSVVTYLKNRQIEEGRIRTSSYGEEMPAQKGRTEAAYAKNRRAEFSFENFESH